MRKRLLVLGMFAAFAAQAAMADTVSVSLLDAVQAGAPGTVFSYDATLSAPQSNAGNVYLFGDSYNSGPLTVDDSGLFLNFPAYLTPGETVTGTLFTVNSFANSAAGVTTGSFALQGGSTNMSQDTLASVSFTAQVTSTTQVTPEPSSLVLLMSGAAGLAGLVRRRSVRATAAS